jgi:hypothetical protein
VNWHLNADEVEYIINDCDAKALFADTRYPSGVAAKAPAVTLKVSIGEDAEGFEPYEEAAGRVRRRRTSTDPTPGSAMLYTSGTTGPAQGRLSPQPAMPVMAMLNLAEPGRRADVRRAGLSRRAAGLRRALVDGDGHPAGVPRPLGFSEGVLRTIEKRTR